jgi:sugar phosphate isomerase/epimerase
MERYLARLERAMATIVTHGDVLLPPRDRDRAALAAVGTAAAELRALLATAAADPRTRERIAAEARLLDYTLGALCALDAWLGGDEATAERALDDLSRASRVLHGLGTDVIGTWGAHDLELTQHFFAAALRARRR